MGLTKNSTGKSAIDDGLKINKKEGNKVIALMGNPNVGKSTVFNALTGMNQHTGNWPGKTVSGAHGRHKYNGTEYILVDLPGTYSLSAHSAEEEVARNFLVFDKPDAAIVVCDATCLERNLNLVLQTITITKKVVVAVNLMDEANRRGIKIDIKALKKRLGVPVIATSARKKEGLPELMEETSKVIRGDVLNPIEPQFGNLIEESISKIEPYLEGINIDKRFLACKLITADKDFLDAIDKNLSINIKNDYKIKEILKEVKIELLKNGIPLQQAQDEILSSYVKSSETIANETVNADSKSERNRKLDKILTGKWTGIPIMLALLGGIFWLTITGANYPSQLLSSGLFYIGEKLKDLFEFFNSPWWLTGLIVDGVYRTSAWVVSVMLPPMAIFFPLFTLLEDFGYLPRVAFHLDHSFQKAGACGKQALTTCMGFGCNAAGIVGCRIIDSPRERLIAMITNNFVPCNGRFPTLIAIITMFFAGITTNSFLSGLVGSSLLLGLIILGIIMTFLVSRILSSTILKGVPSSFTLELPPYRRPQIGKVIIRSIFDRTLFVLARAIIVAAPAGLILWLLANIEIKDIGLLQHLSDFINPFATIFGLDGVILLSFILAFPANEILLPIILMCYLSQGSLMEYGSLDQLKDILVANGWTGITALSVMLFSLMHFPCSTTCLTIKKESGGLKWMSVSIIVPTITGLIICFLVSNLCRLIAILF